MAVSKVSLSIEEDVVAEARERAGRRELSSYVPDALLEEARRLWGGPDAARQRRRSA